MTSKDWVSAEKQDKNSDQIDVPQLRFPGFNDEWKTYKLGDFLSFYSTNSFSRFKLNYKSGTVKNIHYGDIHTNYPPILNCNSNKIPYINNNIDLSKFESASYLKDGDLIIADASEDYDDIGKAIEVVNVGDKKILSGLHTILARDENNRTVNGFKSYLFLSESIRHNLKVIANGISVLGISKTNLSKIEVKIPSLSEQQKIVELFNLIQEKIILMEKTLVLYERYKKQLQNEIFNKKLIKYELKAIKLKDICTIKKGKQLNKSDMLETGEYYVLNGGKNPSGFTNSWNVNENTITISEGGNSCGYVSFNTEKFYCGGHCYYLTITSEVDNYYLFNYLKFIELKIMRLRVGSGLPNIQKGDIENLLINLPPITIQEEISLFFKFINNYILLKENEKEKMINFKKALLQQMFI